MNKGSFPDFAVKVLTCLVEGSQASLSSLATSSVASLNALYQTDIFDTETTAAKIKLIATRKCLVKNPRIVVALEGDRSSNTSTTDIFEDENVDFMWRWEAAILDFLPEGMVGQVKKARNARKKFSTHFGAIARLLTSLNDADKLILTSNTTTPSDVNKAKLDKILAKISLEEEKVLKFEREEEKVRLALEAKRKQDEIKANDKKLEQDEKAKEKQAQAEQARLAKEEAAKEKLKKKEEAARLKEEAKLQKQREKDEKERKEQAEKEAELNKQKQCMMSFFSAKALAAAKRESKEAKPSKTLPVANTATLDLLTKLKQDGFDSDQFWSSISEGNFNPRPLSLPRFSKQAKNSRKRRTKRILVSVDVTVYPDDPFTEQPYVERRDVEVLNKRKFLLFQEDVRPPYWGTWSKRSAIVTGRRPFAKDTSFLDYEYDSEAEWEEGDDEEGEDVENDIGDDEEDKEVEDADENEDGWLAADDEVEDDLDEETKMIRKKHLESAGSSHLARGELAVSIVAPTSTGQPITTIRSDECISMVDGLTVNEGRELLCSHASIVSDCEIHLTAFPPALVDEKEDSPDESSPDGNISKGKDLTDDEMKTFVRFVHGCTLGSRDKVVDEFRSKHDSIAKSRALVLRVLDGIAAKRKHPTKGLYWEVKKETLEQLGLHELVEAEAVDTNEEKQQAMKTIVTFVHNSTFKSKGQVVDELRSAHESATSSRAEAFRILESIAEKKKHPVSGSYWEVKQSVREELGLLEKLPSTPPAIVKPSTQQQEGEANAVDSNSLVQSVEKPSETKTLVTSPAHTSASGNTASPGRKRQVDMMAGSVKVLDSLLIKKRRKSNDS